MMKSIILYTLLGFTIAVYSFSANAGPDYEKQLNHSLKRWVADVKLLHKTDTEIELTYLCKSSGSANGLAREFQDHSHVIEKGQWLGYTVKVIVRQAIPASLIEYNQWIRRQFFLGIAYTCDMDRVNKVGSKSL